MQIHNLPERSAIADTDVYAVDTGTTTGKTPFSLIKSLIKTFTLQFSDLTLKTTASNNDVFAIDDGTGSKKIRFSELKNLVVQNATPGYNSGDSETVGATSWSNVSKVTSGLTFTSTLNRITTMMKNCRYLYNLLGTTDISGSGQSTITGAIGGTDISGTGDGTITGAISDLNTAVISLNNAFMITNPYEIVNSNVVSSLESDDNYLVVCGHVVYFSIRWNMRTSTTGSVTALKMKDIYSQYLPMNYNHHNGVISTGHETWTNATGGLVYLNRVWQIGLGGGFSANKGYVASGMYII